MSKPKRRTVKRRSVKIRKIRLNRGGYDSRGRYFGTGAPLYEVEIGDVFYHVRSRNKAELRNVAQNAEDWAIGRRLDEHTLKTY